MSKPILALAIASVVAQIAIAATAQAQVSLENRCEAACGKDVACYQACSERTRAKRIKIKTPPPQSIPEPVPLWVRDVLNSGSGPASGGGGNGGGGRGR